MSHLRTCFLILNPSPNDNASYLKESDPCIDTVFKVATLDPLSSSCISSSSTATVTIWSSSSYTKRRSRIHQRYLVKIVNNCISLLLLNSTAMLTSSKMVKFHVRGHHAISNSLLLKYLDRRFAFERVPLFYSSFLSTFPHILLDLQQSLIHLPST